MRIHCVCMFYVLQQDLVLRIAFYKIKRDLINCDLFSIEELYNILNNECRKYSTPLAVVYEFVWCTQNQILFWIYSWLLHLIPAYIIDGITAIFGKQRRYVNLKILVRSPVEATAEDGRDIAVHNQWLT